MSPELARKLRESSVEVRDGGRHGKHAGGGSGVIWSANGLIVTNAHVVRSKTPVVKLHDGREFPAEVLRLDKERDLAVLKIDATGLPAATIGDSRKLRVGQLVTAIGNPLGVVGAVSTGIIHANNGKRWIQADVRLAPGNSGGMLADAQGHVIGINTMIYAGLALAVPSNAAAAFVRGEDKPLLGISMNEVLIQEKPALVILEVQRGSLAEKSGLMLGDVLLLSADDLHTALEARDTLHLNFLRGGIAHELDIALPSQPSEALAA